MIIRLSHPYKWHRTLEVLDTDRGDLTVDQARSLVRGGGAVDADDLIEDTGGGWYSVDLGDSEPAKVRGYPAAIAALRERAR